MFHNRLRAEAPATVAKDFFWYTRNRIHNLALLADVTLWSDLV